MLPRRSNKRWVGSAYSVFARCVTCVHATNRTCSSATASKQHERLMFHRVEVGLHAMNPVLMGFEPFNHRFKTSQHKPPRREKP